MASGGKLQKYNYQTVSEIAESPNADIVFTRSGRVVVSKIWTRFTNLFIYW